MSTPGAARSSQLDRRSLAGLIQEPLGCVQPGRTEELPIGAAGGEQAAPSSQVLRDDGNGAAADFRETSPVVRCSRWGKGSRRQFTTLKTEAE